jgi:hypothetical protein
MELLEGAVDCHVHACPHINARSVDVLDASRAAAAAGMRGIGLMDNFANSAGLAALARRELGGLEVDVFGGLIMEPPAGGVSAEAVKIALGYGYAPGDGARFISLPTHHTRNIARLERRSPQYVEACLEIPERGELPDPLTEILDLVAAHDVVLNAGHVSGPEAVRLVEVARARGVERILVPASYMAPEEVREITAAGAFAEFSFFFISHATQVGLTHVDAQMNLTPPVSLARMHELITVATPACSVLSSDCGVYVLPPPVEGLREFVLMIASTGFDADAIRVMIDENPGRLFEVGAGRPERGPGDG